MECKGGRLVRRIFIMTVALLFMALPAHARSFGSIKSRSLIGCNTIDTDATGLMSCGIDEGGATGFASTDENYLVTTSSTVLSAEVVVGDSQVTFDSLITTGAASFLGGVTADLIGDVTGNSDTSTETDSNATWTLHDNYPAACTAGYYAHTIGDTLTCTDATTEINAVVNALGGTGLTCAAQSCDVDLGTSIATTELVSPTGSDTNVVTGTAGSTDDCAKWNADGDLVTAGAACGSGAGGWVGTATSNLDMAGYEIISSTSTVSFGDDKMISTGGLSFPADNVGIEFGASEDASIYFDSTEDTMVIKNDNGSDVLFSHSGAEFKGTGSSTFREIVVFSEFTHDGTSGEGSIYYDGTNFQRKDASGWSTF